MKLLYVLLFKAVQSGSLAKKKKKPKTIKTKKTKQRNKGIVSIGYFAIARDL